MAGDARGDGCGERHRCGDVLRCDAHDTPEGAAQKRQQSRPSRQLAAGEACATKSRRRSFRVSWSTMASRPPGPAFSVAPAFCGSWLSARSPQRRTSSAVARRETGATATTLLARSAASLVGWATSRGGLPEGCPAQHCAEGGSVCVGLPGTMLKPGTPHRKCGRGSLFGFVAASESKTAPPMARASFDVVRRGRAGHNVKAGIARGAR